MLTAFTPLALKQPRLLEDRNVARYGTALTSDLFSYLLRGRRCPGVEQDLRINREDTTASALSLDYSAFVRRSQGFSLCLCVLPVWVCLPALCSLLPASAPHGGQGFPLAAGCLSRHARPHGGRALGLCHVAADSSCHSLTVAHRGKLCRAACEAMLVPPGQRSGIWALSPIVGRDECARSSDGARREKMRVRGGSSHVCRCWHVFIVNEER